MKTTMPSRFILKRAVRMSTEKREGGRGGGGSLKVRLTRVWGVVDGLKVETARNGSTKNLPPNDKRSHKGRRPLSSKVGAGGGFFYPIKEGSPKERKSQAYTMGLVTTWASNLDHPYKTISLSGQGKLGKSTEREYQRREDLRGRRPGTEIPFSQSPNGQEW